MVKDNLLPSQFSLPACNYSNAFVAGAGTAVPQAPAVIKLQLAQTKLILPGLSCPATAHSAGENKMFWCWTGFKSGPAPQCSSPILRAGGWSSSVQCFAPLQLTLQQRHFPRREHSSLPRSMARTSLLSMRQHFASPTLLLQPCSTWCFSPRLPKREAFAPI